MHDMTQFRPKTAHNDHFPDMISVRELTEYSDFTGLYSAWSRLLSNRCRHSVFLVHEWFDACWQWAQQNSQLWMLCFYDQDHLIGVAPMCKRTQTIAGIQIRYVSLLEVPDSQECDVIIGNDNSQPVMSAMVDYLAHSRAWDIAVFSKLQEDSILHGCARNACIGSTIKFKESQVGENLEVDLTETWESYYSTRSRRLKKSNNHVRNKICTDGKSVELLWSMDQDSPSVLEDKLLKATNDVSAKSWKSNTGLTLDNPGPRAFLDRLSSHARKNNWLSIWGLQIDNNVVATEYQLIFGDTVLALRADYDPSFAHLSPGSYLNWKILESMVGGNHRVYRMGPGANPYKLKWSNAVTELYEIRMFNDTIRGRYLWLIECVLKPTGTNLLEMARWSWQIIRRSNLNQELNRKK